MIIAADFNADPDEDAILEMKKSLKSAFEEVLGGTEPPFTTFKYRKPTELQKRTIDYAFYNSLVNGPSGWFEMPIESSIPAIGNPN